ncbi:hypothetical protein B0H14DRAFT_3858949 [Mycena olivaceomarginata]|nr:hypothetical protein B0H14DRAFT_3858949 [Mycena olivaceomarginata]
MRRTRTQDPQSGSKTERDDDRADHLSTKGAWRVARRRLHLAQVSPLPFPPCTLLTPPTTADFIHHVQRWRMSSDGACASRTASTSNRPCARPIAPPTRPVNRASTRVSKPAHPTPRRHAGWSLRHSPTHLADPRSTSKTSSPTSLEGGGARRPPWPELEGEWERLALMQQGSFSPASGPQGQGSASQGVGRETYSLRCATRRVVGWYSPGLAHAATGWGVGRVCQVGRERRGKPGERVCSRSHRREQ